MKTSAQAALSALILSSLAAIASPVLAQPATEAGGSIGRTTAIAKECRKVHKVGETKGVDLGRCLAASWAEANTVVATASSGGGSDVTQIQLKPLVYTLDADNGDQLYIKGKAAYGHVGDQPWTKAGPGSGQVIAAMAEVAKQSVNLKSIAMGPAICPVWVSRGRPAGVPGAVLDLECAEAQDVGGAMVSDSHIYLDAEFRQVKGIGTVTYQGAVTKTTQKYAKWGRSLKLQKWDQAISQLK